MNPSSPQAADDLPPDQAEDTSLDVAKAKRDKHAELLETLLCSLDSLIYVELGCLYYLDCTLTFLLLRSAVQILCLSTRPGPSTRSALAALITSNVACTILHIVREAPRAGEATQFYLHGSILIDLVGQLGPTSKWRLFYMDVLVLVLQIVMLCLCIEKRVVQSAADKQLRSADQDLDAEEAGFSRSRDAGDEVGEGDAGIEMQELLGSSTAADGEAATARPGTHHLDDFYTGQMVLAKVGIVDTIARDMTNTATADGAAGASTGFALPGLNFAVRWRNLG